MSVNVESIVVERGSDEYIDAAWSLKERVRRRDGVLRQRRGFFRNAYRRSKVYIYHDRSANQLVGFCAVRSDGYVLFLAVDPDYRNHGFGERLIARVADEYGKISCHARATNDSALAFYEHIGFEAQRRVADYYEDGGDAIYLTLGDEGLRSRIAKLLS